MTRCYQLLSLSGCYFYFGFRYLKFIDALRDLDDCLTMVHLFAALPAIERESIQPDQIHNCQGYGLLLFRDLYQKWDLLLILIYLYICFQGRALNGRHTSLAHTN